MVIWALGGFELFVSRRSPSSLFWRDLMSTGASDVFWSLWWSSSGWSLESTTSYRIFSACRNWDYDVSYNFWIFDGFCRSSASGSVDALLFFKGSDNCCLIVRQPGSSRCKTCSTVFSIYFRFWAAKSLYFILCSKNGFLLLFS